MWPKPQQNVDLVTCTEETLNGKLDFFCGDTKGVACKKIPKGLVINIAGSCIK